LFWFMFVEALFLLQGEARSILPICVNLCSLPLCWGWSLFYPLNLITVPFAVLPVHLYMRDFLPTQIFIHKWPSGDSRYVVNGLFY
jgi:hypothetical protein